MNRSNKAGAILKSVDGLNESDALEKINQYTRRPLTKDEVYIFPVTLCNNDIDRDTEQFTLESLRVMADLYKGKTGIKDHDWSTDNQVARIFDTEVVPVAGKTTASGEPFYELRALCYMLNNEQNKPLIDEIEAGIKKEVSVGVAIGRCTCSICGRDFWNDLECSHHKGELYNGRTCFIKLENPTDAYEWSFVAIPSQKEAGVTKKYDEEEAKRKAGNKNMFTYDDKLKDFGIDEETFKGFEMESEKVMNILQKSKAPEKEEFISAEKAKSFLGTEKTADEILNLAKDAEGYKANAELYTKLFDEQVADALKEGVKAKGEGFDQERWEKILRSFSYEEVKGQKEEWHNDAQKELHGGERVSEPFHNVRNGRNFSDKDINF